jgi:peptidoglycan hydrolase CwlO-like protein
LIYLINNDELSEYRKDGEPELLRKAKKNAVIDYIKKQRMLLESKIGSFEDEIKKHTNEKTLQEQVQDLNNQLNETNEKIDSANQSNKNISNALLPVQKRLSRSKATMARYKELKSQYDTDINRLTFIVENELISSNRTPRTKCPFCESHMVPHDHTSYIEASQAELVKLINNLNDLENTRIELKDQIDDDEALIKDYDEQLQEINKTLKESLIPQRNQITNLLSNYTERIQIEGALVQFKEFSLRFEDDIKEYEQEKSSHFTPFDGKKVLFELVSNGIENNAKQILSEIGYTPLESVGFDLSSFDLIVNNRMKNTHGKGYKAFFNSVLTLALLQYLCEHSTKNPGFYIFDSPLKGLTLSEEVINNKNIRVGYFEYLLNLNSESQIVIMENTNDRELPLIASNEKVKVYEFTQVEGKGRYGFLNSVRRK